MARRRAASPRESGWHWCVLLLLALIVMLPRQSLAAERPLVRLAVSLTPLSAPVIVALEKGYFERQGIDARPIKIIGGHRTIAAMFAGEADIATSSEAVVMFNSFKRDDFAIFATFVSNEDDVQLLARRDSAIVTPRDLKGRRIGTIRGSAAHFFLSQILVLQGLTPSDVSIAYFQPEELADALASHAVDAVSVWQPFGLIAQRKMGDAIVAIPHERAYIETFNLIARRDFIAGNSKAIEAMLRGLILANEFIASHPQESQELVSKFINQEFSLVRSLWPTFTFEVTLKQWLLATLDSEARWAMAEHLVEGNSLPDYLDFVSYAALERIQPRAVTIYR